MAWLSSLRPFALFAILAAAVSGGWLARGWWEDSQRLTAVATANAAITAAMARESRIAASVEQRLAELQANQHIIDRGVIREIQRPVYRRVCLEPGAIRLLNHAAAGTAPDSTSPVDGMPGNLAAAD